MWLLGNDEVGHAALDVAVAGGVLFGKQKTAITGSETAGYWEGRYYDNPRIPDVLDPTPVAIHRSRSVTVPLVDLSLGLSYEVQRMKVSAGYRWERYFDVLDGGYDEHKDVDRTIDGPYFKLAIGFGG